MCVYLCKSECDRIHNVKWQERQKERKRERAREIKLYDKKEPFVKMG